MRNASDGRFKDCTNAEKILLAACWLSEKSRWFTKEALVVAAWRSFPETFGLVGYKEQYPDANKVKAALSERRGVIKGRRWLVLENFKLSLSARGRDAAQEILYPNAQKDNGTEILSTPKNKKKNGIFMGLPEPIYWLLKKLGVPVVEKFRGDIKTSITFGDACRLWDVKEFAREEEMVAALQSFDEKFRELDALLYERDIRVSDDKMITMDDMKFIKNIHERLQDDFGKRLSFAKAR